MLTNNLDNNGMTVTWIGRLKTQWIIKWWRDLWAPEFGTRALAWAVARDVYQKPNCVTFECQNQCRTCVLVIRKSLCVKLVTISILLMFNCSPSNLAVLQLVSCALVAEVAALPQSFLTSLLIMLLSTHTNRSQIKFLHHTDAENLHFLSAMSNNWSEFFPYFHTNSKPWQYGNSPKTWPECCSISKSQPHKAQPTLEGSLLEW